jgi:hypothetical protein
MADLELALSLLVLWVLAFGCWRPYRADQLRQELFGLRDQLFDYAAGGGVSFDHPAYTRLRTTLNGMIRFAHRVTFLRLCLNVLAERVWPDLVEAHPLREWERAVRGLPSPDAQRELYRLYGRMLTTVFRHLARSSPRLMACLAVLRTGSSLSGAARHLSARLLGLARPGLELLQSQAIEAQARELGIRYSRFGRAP